jgi:hypothetical protein
MKRLIRAAGVALLLAVAIPATASAAVPGDGVLDGQISRLRADVSTQVAQRDALEQKIAPLRGNLGAIGQFASLFALRGRLDANVQRDADSFVTLSMARARVAALEEIRAVQGKPAATGFGSDVTFVTVVGDVGILGSHIDAQDNALSWLLKDPLANLAQITDLENRRDQDEAASLERGLKLADVIAAHLKG